MSHHAFGKMLIGMCWLGYAFSGLTIESFIFHKINQNWLHSSYVTFVQLHSVYDTFVSDFHLAADCILFLLVGPVLLVRMWYYLVIKFQQV